MAIHVLGAGRGPPCDSVRCFVELASALKSLQSAPVFACPQASEHQFGISGLPAAASLARSVVGCVLVKCGMRRGTASVGGSLFERPLPFQVVVSDALRLCARRVR